WRSPAAFVNEPPPTALYTLSLHDALPILQRCCGSTKWAAAMAAVRPFEDVAALLRIGERTWWSLAIDDHLEAFAAHPRIGEAKRSEEHTSELQSRENLVCRLLLEKKK